MPLGSEQSFAAPVLNNRYADKRAIEAHAMNVRFPAGKVSPQFNLSRLMTIEIDADYQSVGFPTGLFSVNVADIAGERGFER